jgi:vancomycin permeability regulator SanA
MTKRKKFVAVIATFMAAAILSVVIINLAVVYKTDENIRQTDELGVGYDCILVLGAGLRSDGSPSDMLADRLRVAISLYKNGVSDVILLSGDCSGEDYDEVTAMYNYCISAGVPESALVKDNFGFSTYESIYNAKENGYKAIVIVTQKYHLYRALYIARSFEAESVGVSADLRGYRNQTYREIREHMARVKDFLKAL